MRNYSIGVTISTLAIAACLMAYCAGYINGYKYGTAGEARIAGSASRILVHAANIVECGDMLQSSSKLKDAGKFYEFYSVQTLEDAEKVSLWWVFRSPSFFFSSHDNELHKDIQAFDSVECSAIGHEQSPDD